MMGIVCSIALVSGVSDRTSLNLKSTRLDTKTAQLANFCLQGWKDGRDRLRRGVFSARGRQFAPGTGRHPELNVPIEVFCAFDHDRDLLRYDGRKPVRTVIGGSSADAKGPRNSHAFAQEEVIEKYTRGPQMAITWCSTNAHSVAYLVPSSTPSPKHLPNLDVRILGVALWNTVTTGMGYSDQCASFSKWELEDAADEGDGRLRCVWISVHGQFRKEETRHRVWFDERQGFSPVRSEVRTTRAAIPGFPAKDVLNEQSDTTWICVSGVWVPKTFSIRLFFDDRCRESRELGFDWRSVNEPVDGRLFELAGLELPRDARIMDHRLGTPVVIGRVGEVLAASAVPPPGLGLRWTLAILTMGVILAIAIYLVLKRFRRARNADA